MTTVGHNIENPRLISELSPEELEALKAEYIAQPDYRIRDISHKYRIIPIHLYLFLYRNKLWRGPDRRKRDKVARVIPVPASGKALEQFNENIREIIARSRGVACMNITKMQGYLVNEMEAVQKGDRQLAMGEFETEDAAKIKAMCAIAKTYSITQRSLDSMFAAAEKPNGSMQVVQSDIDVTNDE